MDYTEIQFKLGSTIFMAVNKLLRYKEEGKLVCGKFNDHMLYSDTVTLDLAYKQITGMTKSEFDEAEKKRQNEYELHKQEHKQKIPELIKEWIKKGHDVLSENKWDLWDECVPIRLGDLYEGMELGCCLDIIYRLKDGKSFDEVKNFFNNQGHSGMSHSVVCSMIYSFYDKGKEFIDYVDKK